MVDKRPHGWGHFRAKENSEGTKHHQGRKHTLASASIGELSVDEDRKPEEKAQSF